MEKIKDVIEITKDTYNKIAIEYSKATKIPEVRKALIKSAIKFSDYITNKKANLLILGSGDGRDALFFSELGYQVTVVDYSQNMLHLARNKIQHGEFILCDIQNLSLPANSFDGVWASACLYHLKRNELKSVFCRINTILKNSGIFYFNLRQGDNEKLDHTPRSFPEGGPRYYTFYRQEEIFSLIKIFQLLEFKLVDEILKEDYYQVWLRKK